MAFDPNNAVPVVQSGAAPVGFDPANAVPVAASAQPAQPTQANQPAPSLASVWGQMEDPDVAALPSRESVVDFVNAAGHHAMSGLHGTAQLIEHGLAKGADLIDPTAQNLSSVVTGQRNRAEWNQSLQNTVASDDAVLAQRERDYQASTPDSPASYAGATVGEIAPFLVGGVANAVRQVGEGAGNLVTRGLQAAAGKGYNLPAWADALLPKVVSGAAQGATVAATAPVTAPGDYWGNKISQVGTGAATGGALPLVPAAAGAVKSVVAAPVNAIRNAARPFTNPAGIVGDWAQQQAAAAGVTPQDLATRLSGAPVYVPGSIPTAAQAAPLPFLVQAEKTVTTNPDLRGAFADRQAQNNAARLAQLSQVAGQPGTLDAATAARADQARAGYAAAYANGPDPDLVTKPVQAQWTALQQRPAIQQAFADGRQDLANEGQVLPDGNSPYDPHIVQLADYAKKSLDAKIGLLQSRGSTDGLSGLIDSRNALVDAVDRISPQYKAVRQQFAAVSPPITSMQAATDMLTKLSGNSLTTAAPGELAGAPLMTLPGFRSAINGALRGTEFPIQPDSLRSLQGIQSDLQRETASNALKAAGSDTAYNLQAPGLMARSLYGADYTGGGTAPRIVGGLLGGVGGSMLGAHVGTVGGAIAGQAAAGKVAQAGNQRVMSALAEALADPQRLATLLRQTRPQQGTPRLVPSGASLMNGLQPYVGLMSSSLFPQRQPVPQITQSPGVAQ